MASLFICIVLLFMTSSGYAQSSYEKSMIARSRQLEKAFQANPEGATAYLDLWKQIGLLASDLETSHDTIEYLTSLLRYGKSKDPNINIISAAPAHALIVMWDWNEPAQRVLIRAFILEELKTLLKDGDVGGLYAQRVGGIIAEKIYKPGDHEVADLLRELFIRTDKDSFGRLRELFYNNDSKLPKKSSRFIEAATESDPDLMETFFDRDTRLSLLDYLEMARHQNFDILTHGGYREEAAVAAVKDALRSDDYKTFELGILIISEILKYNIQGFLDQEMLDLSTEPRRFGDQHLEAIQGGILELTKRQLVLRDYRSDRRNSIVKKQQDLIKELDGIEEPHMNRRSMRDKLAMQLTYNPQDYTKDVLENTVTLMELAQKKGLDFSFAQARIQKLIGYADKRGLYAQELRLARLLPSAPLLPYCQNLGKHHADKQYVN